MQLIRLARLIRILSRLLAPIVWTLRRDGVMLLPLTHKHKHTHTPVQESEEIYQQSCFGPCLYGLKGTVILSAVKENPTMKRPCGTPADTMAAGRSGLLDLTGLYSIEQFT